LEAIHPDGKIEKGRRVGLLRTPLQCKSSIQKRRARKRVARREMDSILIGSMQAPGFAAPGLPRIYSVASCGRSVDTPLNANRWICSSFRHDLPQFSQPSE
jgi:hypothetical protein